MNLLPRVLPGLLALAFALPASAFEGTIHFDMTSGRDTQQMIYSLKGEQARFEIPQAGAGGMSAIVDLPKQQMTMMMPEQRMYMVMSLEQAPGSGRAQARRDEVGFEDTGETEDILGHTCRKYRITDRDSTTDVWGAEGIGMFMAQLGGGGPMQRGSVPGWQQELGTKGFFPLRVVGRNRRGKETFRMEATKIDETTLSDALFTIPEGYQQFNMGGMLRGLVPGMK